MAGPIHTYGPACLLSDGELDLSALRSSPTPPRLRPQFFYVSAASIDDPLSPLPPPSWSGSENDKIPPQPFSAKDNNALEAAWQTLRSIREAGPSRRSSVRGSTAETEAGRGAGGNKAAGNAKGYSGGSLAIRENDHRRALDYRKRGRSPIDIGSTSRSALGIRKHGFRGRRKHECA